MSVLITLLIGFLKFFGMSILILPFFRLYIVGGSDYDGNNKILKFYLNIFPIISIVIIALGVFILALYTLGK